MATIKTLTAADIKQIAVLPFPPRRIVQAILLLLDRSYYSNWGSIALFGFSTCGDLPPQRFICFHGIAFYLILEGCPSFVLVS